MRGFFWFKTTVRFTIIFVSLGSPARSIVLWMYMYRQPSSVKVICKDWIALHCTYFCNNLDINPLHSSVHAVINNYAETCALGSQY